MWEWLLAPIDPSRAHVVDMAMAWHGRLMLVGWGILAPLAVMIARFLKVLPGQDWPNELDSQFWWRTHWIGQSLVYLMAVFAMGLIFSSEGQGGTLHGLFGYVLLGFATLQIAMGIFRGSKGGPTAPARDGSLSGDHYDMTRLRLVFEMLHKSIGYCALMLAMSTILQGLWLANAPHWMWLAICLWWVLLIVAFVLLQRAGWAVDTYQAIWGPDPAHPGNKRQPQGWGMRRPKEENYVGRDRGDGIRGH